MLHTALFITSAILMAPGIVMPLIPMLPALPYMLVIALLFGIYDGFTALTAHEFFVLIIIAGVSVAVDQLAGIAGAKWSGAHAKSLVAGIIGSILGALMFPPFGALLGLFASVFIAEIFFLRSRRHALKAAGGAVFGAAAGMAISAALAVSFLSFFIFFVLR